MDTITQAVKDVFAMIWTVVSELFGKITSLTPAVEGGVAFGHFFFIGVTVALVLLAINLIKRLIYGA